MRLCLKKDKINFLGIVEQFYYNFIIVKHFIEYHIYSYLVEYLTFLVLQGFQPMACYLTMELFKMGSKRKSESKRGGGGSAILDTQ